MHQCYAPYTCIENEIRCDVCKNSTLQNVGGREEANKVSVPDSGDHAGGGGEQHGHAHAGDHLGQAGGLAEGEEPVGWIGPAITPQTRPRAHCWVVIW